MERSAAGGALEYARTVLNAKHFVPMAAFVAVRRLKAIAPPQVQLCAAEAERAVIKAVELRDNDLDAFAKFALQKLIRAFDRAHLRVVGGSA